MKQINASGVDTGRISPVELWNSVPASAVATQAVDESTSSAAVDLLSEYLEQQVSSDAAHSAWL